MEVQNPWSAQVNNEVNSIDMDGLKKIEKKLWKRRSIYKLPASVTDLNKNAYRAQVISFGPYHCNDENLRPMEEHKDRILCHFLRRSGKPLQFYFNLLAEKKDELMGTYYPRWSHDENVFLAIMVRDGCCMLEIRQSYTKPIEESDYDSNDPIFGVHGRHHFLPYIMIDMLKLENQLPMRVLETLLEQDVEAVNRLVCRFFSQKPARPLGRCDHVLDLYRKVLLEEYSTTETDMQAVIPDSILQDPSTSEIQRKMISDSILPEEYSTEEQHVLQIDSTDSILPDPSTIVTEMPTEVKQSILPDASTSEVQRKIISDSVAEMPAKTMQGRIFLGRPNYNRTDSTDSILLDENIDIMPGQAILRDSILTQAILREPILTQAILPDAISIEGESKSISNPSNIEEEMRLMIGVADDVVIRPAKDVYEAGIRIRKSQKRNLRHISFDPDTGALTVPGIIVDDKTEPLFLNLIAYERFHVKADNSVTAYAFFMDNIINDAKDISLLHKYDIVRNALGSDEAAAQLFNSLSKEVALGKYGSLKKVNKDVNEYCKRWWPRWRSYFFQTYMRNPWILISVIAATALFILTVIQTVYTVMSFHQPQDHKS